MINNNSGIMGNLSELTDYKSFSISAENFTGEKGKGGMATEGTGKNCARDLGQGWKVSPSIIVKAHTTFTLADIEGEGAIRHIWLTPTGNFRFYILRFYWDGSDVPSVECPLSDFFAASFIQRTDQTQFHQISSLAVCVNPRFGLNCYWNMPFKKRCRITVENIANRDVFLYYQIDYILGRQSDNIGYFHARFNRVNPLPYKDVYTIVDGIKGKGQYVGTYMLWGVNNCGWWGEGEIKFYMDGDKEFPTICGTGTEDYFCGAYDFDDAGYKDFCTPYSGMTVVRTDDLYRPQMRFSLYRWHITDPIYFEKDLKVTIQALGWRSEGRYLPLQDDISSVAFWYQDKPQDHCPPLPDRDYLEII
ncbi:MAG: DUF2961 domain-containing protein [Clostridia bacterium]|nr:DUF2961 domain-containing protein [Clostridia bacterium]